jgi:hypothetical protein
VPIKGGPILLESFDKVKLKPHGEPTGKVSCLQRADAEKVGENPDFHTVKTLIRPFIHAVARCAVVFIRPVDRGELT